jgi:hypothetical protein
MLEIIARVKHAFAIFVKDEMATTSPVQISFIGSSKEVRTAPSGPLNLLFS